MRFLTPTGNPPRCFICKSRKIALIALFLRTSRNKDFTYLSEKDIFYCREHTQRFTHVALNLETLKLELVRIRR